MSHFYDELMTENDDVSGIIGAKIMEIVKGLRADGREAYRQADEIEHAWGNWDIDELIALGALNRNDKRTLESIYEEQQRGDGEAMDRQIRHLHASVFGLKPSAGRVASIARRASVQPTVGGFLLILGGLLTQEDMRLSKLEARRGRPNTGRLPLLLEASHKAAAKVAGKEGSSDPEDLGTLKAALRKSFTADFPPLKKVLKAIDDFIDRGVVPRYPIPKGAF